jgi:hypothetical protein
LSYTVKPDECDACGWPTSYLTECDAYARNPDHGPFTPEEEKERAWLCEVCRSTYAGNAYMYPRQYDNRQVLSTIAWGINRVVDEVRRAWNNYPVDWENPVDDE